MKVSVNLSSREDCSVPTSTSAYAEEMDTIQEEVQPVPEASSTQDLASTLEDAVTSNGSFQATLRGVFSLYCESATILRIRVGGSRSFDH